MGKEHSREEWAAGLTLAAGGFFLTLAGPPGPAVFWGLTWSLVNALALFTAAGKDARSPFLLLGINFILAGGWLYAGDQAGGYAFPFLFLLPLLVPLYRGEKRVLLTGLAAALLLITIWHVKEGQPFNKTFLLTSSAAVALAGFFYLIWNRMVETATRMAALKAELDHWQREYQLSRSRLAVAETMAVTDDLTRVYNYRYFDQSLERLLAAGEKSYPVAVLMVDIDHFKEINDAHGHLVGNRVLAEIGAILKQHTREGDIVTRFGGEEFAIILPGSDYHGALQVAERIRKAIAAHKFSNKEAPFALTVSTGLAVWPEDAANKEELVTCADQALYQAKTTGRNSVCPYRLLRSGAGPQSGMIIQ